MIVPPSTNKPISVLSLARRYDLFLLMSTEWLVIYVVSTADWLTRLFEAMTSKALATRIKQLGRNYIIRVEEEEEEEEEGATIHGTMYRSVALISSTFK